LRKFFLAIFLVSYFAVSCFGGEEYLADQSAEPLDFRGVKWGQSAKTLSGLKELYRADDENLVSYSRKGEDMNFGAAKINLVEYVFVNDRLSRVAVTAKGANEDVLLREAAAIYGRETAKIGEDYIWRFTNVSIMFSREPGMGQSVLYYMYIPQK
jgi:hypothetical protein